MKRILEVIKRFTAYFKKTTAPAFEIEPVICQDCGNYFIECECEDNEEAYFN